MHVAYIHQHFVSPNGSAGTRSYEMGQRLMRAGHRVSLVCGANDNDALTGGSTERLVKLEVDGLPLFCINEPYSNKMSFARRVLAFGRFARRATSVVSDLKPDLVFASSTPLTAGIPGMKVTRRLGVPFVFEVRDLWPELPIAIGAVKNPLLIWRLRRLEKQIYFSARHIIALAPGMKKGICRTGYPEDHITMIPNGSDIDVFQPSDARAEDPRLGPKEDVRFVFTGAHGPANGLDAVLDAAVELKKRSARGVQIVFIGDGKVKTHLMERSRGENLDHLIKFLPPMPKTELARLLPQLDVGLMILRNLPAFYYGTSPNKFFDYIASGLPVLNNYPGWLADMIQENDCGRVTPPDDPGAFADTLLWFRDNRDKLSEMGRRARALAEAKFARDILAEQFIETLERVHQQSRRDDFGSRAS